MSDTQQQLGAETGGASSTVRPDRSASRSGVEPTGWATWVIFAGVMLFMLGLFQAMQGLVALLKDEFFLVTSRGLVLHVDYTVWGWVHLILGLVAVGAGVAILRGQAWGRVVGIILAVVSAIANMAFLAAYPVWSATVITVDIIVVYSLAVHGREVDAYGT
jgi:hypothetical protein